MSQKSLHRSKKLIEEAKKNAVSVEFISQYARELHNNPDIVADLRHANEANSDEYSDDEYADLGGLVSQLMTGSIERLGLKAYEARLLGKFSAMSDFNGWYLERVVCGETDFDQALNDYIKVSLFVADGAVE